MKLHDLYLHVLHVLRCIFCLIYTKVHLISRLNARQHDFQHGIKYPFELHDQHSESMNFTLLHDFACFCIHFFQYECCMIFLKHDKSTKLCIRRMLHDYAECIQQIRTLFIIL
jgi:hypothetical protein